LKFLKAHPFGAPTIEEEENMSEISPERFIEWLRKQDDAQGLARIAEWLENKFGAVRLGGLDALNEVAQPVAVEGVVPEPATGVEDLGLRAALKAVGPGVVRAEETANPDDVVVQPFAAS
jgi:hypothetical protein